MLLDTTKLFCIKELLSFCEYSCVSILKGTVHIFRACTIICKVLCWILHGYRYSLLEQRQGLLFFPNISSLHRGRQVYWLGHKVTEMVTLIMK